MEDRKQKSIPKWESLVDWLRSLDIIEDMKDLDEVEENPAMSSRQLSKKSRKNIGTCT